MAIGAWLRRFLPHGRSELDEALAQLDGSRVKLKVYEGRDVVNVSGVLVLAAPGIGKGWVGVQDAQTVGTWGRWPHNDKLLPVKVSHIRWVIVGDQGWGPF